MGIRAYVNNQQQWAERLRGELASQLKRLGSDPSVIPWFEHNSPHLRQRSLVLFLSDGNHSIDSASIDELEEHLKEGRTIIPVLDTLDDAPNKLPDCLTHLNAFALDPSGKAHYKALADLVLTELWLHRSIRKVFISYRRADSSCVAHQLRESLASWQYEVFLDDCTLQPGVDFQHELMWWLNDADFVLLLASPNLAASKWVREEVTAAAHASIGLLAVRWPKGPQGEESDVLQQLMPDQICELNKGSFDSDKVKPSRQRLVESAVDQIIEKVAEIRVRAIQQRLRCLMPYLRESISPEQFEVEDGIQPGDLKLVDRKSGKLFYARVLPFRPTLELIYSLRRDVIDGRNLPKRPSKALFFYRESDRHDQRIAAMEWMLEQVHCEECPERYRVLPYSTGDPLDLGWLT